MAISAIIFLMITWPWVPGQRALARDHEPIDGDVVSDRGVARLCNRASCIVGAVDGYGDGPAIRGERRPRELRCSEIYAAADRGAVYE